MQAGVGKTGIPSASISCIFFLKFFLLVRMQSKDELPNGAKELLLSYWWILITYRNSQSFGFFQQSRIPAALDPIKRICNVGRPGGKFAIFSHAIHSFWGYKPSLV